MPFLEGKDLSYYHICVKGFKERKMKSRKILSLSAHFIKITSIQSYYAIDCLSVFLHGISKTSIQQFKFRRQFGHHKVHLHFNSTSITTSVLSLYINEANSSDACYKCNF